MALLVHFLLLAILGTCTCVLPTIELPTPGARSQVITYPESFLLKGGPYYWETNGKYIATDTFYNNYPVYVGPMGKKVVYSVYFRKSGVWVLDYNEVDEEQSGDVASMKTLFSDKI